MAKKSKERTTIHEWQQEVVMQSKLEIKEERARLVKWETLKKELFKKYITR